MSTAPADTPTEKRCTKCGEVKAVEEFSRDRRARDGRQVRCKACQRAYFTERYEDPAYRERKRERDRACKAERRKDPAYRERKRTYAAERYEDPAVREHYRAYFAERRKDPAYRERARTYAAERRAANIARPDEEVAADAARLRPDGLKRCSTCERTLPLAAFNAKRREPDGRSPICRDCNADRMAARHARDIADTVDRSLDRDGGRCYLCGCDLDADGTSWHVEHVLPRSRADEWPWADVEHVDNTRLACEACNLAKAARTPHEHFARLAALGDEGAAATLKAAAEIRARNATA